MGIIDRYPTYKGGKVTEVVVYANYIGLCRFYRYGHLMKVVNLTGFTVVGHSVGWLVGCFVGSCIGWMDGWIGVWMDGWMGG